MPLSRREFLKVAAAAMAALHAQSASSQTLRLRKEINSLAASELDSFRAGVAAMQALPRDNFMSWEYQRAVHGIPLPTASLPDPPGVASFWRQCKHHTPQFFAWHRWELLFWEEIARQLCGDANFTLPYWEYFQNAALPVALRTPTAGTTNPLFHDRAAGLNDGTATLNTRAANLGWPAINSSAVNEFDYFTFMSRFESNPHDLVHGFIGGDMNDVGTAALDPVFYVHHANVDRYWALWLKQTGRSNPGGTWASTSFAFQTVAGPRTVLAGDAGTTDALDYTYDPPRRLEGARLEEMIRFLKTLLPRLKIVTTRPIPPRPPLPDPAPWRTLSASAGLSLTGQPTVIPVPNQGRALRSLRADPKGVSTDVALILQNITSTATAKKGGFVYQVFVVPSQRALLEGNVNDAAEVGSFSSFSVSAVSHEMHPGHHGPAQLVLQLNAAARKVLTQSAKKDPALVFVRRGLLIDGKEDESNAAETYFTFDEVSIATRAISTR
jgi:tyrosinase